MDTVNETKLLAVAAALVGNLSSLEVSDDNDDASEQVCNARNKQIHGELRKSGCMHFLTKALEACAILDVQSPLCSFASPIVTQVSQQIFIFQSNCHMCSFMVTFVEM